jgi:DNA-binding response OmpR family regulator
VSGGVDVVQRSILIVDEDDARRRGIASSLAARGIRYLDVGDAFAAMAALGRADFGSVLALEGRRTLSMRGLCQLARKRHPEIVIFITPKEGSDEDHIRSVLDLPVEFLELGPSIERFVTELLARVEAVDEATRPGFEVDPTTEPSCGAAAGFGDFNPFEMPSTEDANGVFDSIPRVEIPHLSQRAKLTDPTSLPPIQSASMPSLPIVDRHLVDGLALEPADPVEHTKPDARTAPSSQSTQEASPLVLDGHFEDIEGGAGAAFMMSLFSQDLTGRFAVASGESAGTLYLYRGEPVWADDPMGDVGLYRKLVQKLFVKPDQPVAAVPDGQLLGSLLQAGLLTSTQMHDFMREVVRDRVLAVAQQLSGAYRFTEERAFLDTAPLLRVNPFGLVLESRRRALSPPALMGLQGEIEARYPIPGPGIAAADEKLMPFLRGAKASVVFDGQRTVMDTLASVGLDPFMGTLVVVTLRDARLVTLEDAPRSAAMDLAERAFSDELLAEISMADADAVAGEPISAEEAKAREDIYGLYMRLKPLSQPRQVLGVGVDADEAAVAAAYRHRLLELDPRRIPEGSAQHILTQRVEELRRKVTSAYQTLMLQVGTAGSDNNPF